MEPGRIPDQMKDSYEAPWGKTLKWSSAALVLLALGTMATPWLLPANIPKWSAPLVTWFIPAILIGCLPFIIRGYRITKDAILIPRLFWTTRLHLDGLQSVAAVPGAMRMSLRTFGNGGGFSFTGWYWNKPLGSYRAFVTDLERTVVLRFGNQTVVVSPDSPEAFVSALSGRIR